jgi:hypothetical protein
MKKRSFAFVLGVVGALALVACKSETTTNNGGGGNGTGNAGGNGGGSGMCVDKCGPAITEGGDVCSGTSSATLYDNLISCAQSSCATDCPTLIMDHGAADADANCGTCLQTNCGTDFTDCSNDV